MSFFRIHPVIVGAGFLFARRTNERQVLYSGDILRIRQMQVTVRIFLLIQRLKRAVSSHQFDQCRVFVVSACAPLNVVRLRKTGNVVHPFLKRRKLGCHRKILERVSLA